MPAFSPKKRAAVMASLMTGMTISEVARKHGVSMSTVSKWAREVRSELAKPNIEDQFARRKAAFAEQFTEMMAQVVEMNTAQARLLSDPDYIRKQTSSDLNALSNGVLTRAERLFRLTQDGPPRTEQQEPEVIEAEAILDVPE